MLKIETTKSVFNHKILHLICMFRCSPNFRFIHHTNYKIIVFKVEKQAFQSFLELKSFGFPNFQKIFLYTSDDRSSFYSKKLS